LRIFGVYEKLSNPPKFFLIINNSGPSIGAGTGVEKIEALDDKGFFK